MKNMTLMSGAGVKVKTGVKGGKLATNHNGAGLKVKTGLKAGRIAMNHSARPISAA
jgi:hypothetical protein